MEKANIRTYFSIIPQTRLGSERLVVKILYAFLIYHNHEQAGAKLHRPSYFLYICHLTIDLTNSSEESALRSNPGLREKKLRDKILRSRITS